MLISLAALEIKAFKEEPHATNKAIQAIDLYRGRQIILKDIKLHLQAGEARPLRNFPVINCI